MKQNQDTEITLGTGRLLFIFFALVAICALFFSLGFSLGKGSAEPAAAAGDTPSLAGTKETSGAARPSAVVPESQVPASSELTFYKSVEERTPEPEFAAVTPSDGAVPPPALSLSAAPSPGYIVQVAAVSKREDAEALQGILRQKQYPVYVLSNSTTDRLFRVQVGPFASLEDAEDTRTRLVGDGYNPILRR